jgi:hypothetical protein
MALRPTHRNESQRFVTPAEAGGHVPRSWIPAFAGMTRLSTEFRWPCDPPIEMKVSASSPPRKRGSMSPGEPGFPLPRE